MGPGGARDLPWRATRDPWAVLVSETMLAQTQVARVIPKWEAFLARWPTPLACADAPTAEVIAAWAGLGYYRRARSLHEAAVVIVDRHGGSVPADLGSLMKLPGVGRYTARAVLAFAFEHRAGVVDTNVARVLARAVAGRPLPWAAAQELADRLVASESPWAWNQSVMDLGATLCTSRQPKCDSCPLGAGRDAAILCAIGRATAAPTQLWGQPAHRGRSPDLPDQTARAEAGCWPPWWPRTPRKGTGCRLSPSPPQPDGPRTARERPRSPSGWSMTDWSPWRRMEPCGCREVTDI